MDSELAKFARRIASARDLAAEQELCRMLLPRLRLFVARHWRDVQAADDLAQDAMLVVLSALRAGRIEDLERVPAFALATCRSLLVSGHRRSRRHSELLVRSETDEVALPPQDAPLDGRRLARCLEELNARDRRVIELTFWEEETADEIAQTLGTSPGNVRVIRHRALEHLHDCISRGEILQ